MLVPVPYLHPMRPHHLDTNSYPQPLSNPTWVPIYPIFLPLPPQTPDSFPPPKTHRVSPLTPVLPPLCCLGFSLPEGGLRKPASAGALGNSPRGGGLAGAAPVGTNPKFCSHPPPTPHPSLIVNGVFCPSGCGCAGGAPWALLTAVRQPLRPPLPPPPHIPGCKGRDQHHVNVTLHLCSVSHGGHLLYPCCLWQRDKTVLGGGGGGSPCRLPPIAPPAVG